MLIHPAEPALGYHPRRHSGSDARSGPETEPLPGGVIRGRVEALLADGQVRVSAAGRLFQFHPPRPLVPGELIELTVVSREPQLVLELADGTSSGDPAPELSRAATLIARLSAPGTPRPGLIPAAQPLLPAPPTDGAFAAPRLAAAISGSGLFYEAHQAEWVKGALPFARISAEPQARLQTTTPLALPGAAPLEVHAEPVTGGGPQTAARQLQTHPDALPLLRAQLDMLDSRRLYWCGELWPGQTASWEIIDQDEHAASGTPAEDRASRTWQTRLNLELPTLGPVMAVLQSRGDSAAIRIYAASTDSADRLGAETASLHSALDAAGVSVTELAVGHDASLPQTLREAK